jgi:hypothetical protein
LPLDSANVTLEYNVMFNAPRAGVNINDGPYGGHLLVGNLIFNTVRETSDHGCFNSWDRQPYVWNPANASDLLPAPTALVGNFLVNNYHSTWPIDHDDGSKNYVARSNVMAWGGFKNYLGVVRRSAWPSFPIIFDAAVWYLAVFH